MRTKEQLQKRYDELEGIFKYDYERSGVDGSVLDNKEVYWLGRTDGLRVALHLLHKEIESC